MVRVTRARDAEAELNLLPGFRFHPTDEELVLHYLSPRATNQGIPAPIIAELDLYKYDPWLLPEKALFGQKEWYFFTPRDRKYLNGTRPNRAAGGGYWKATGADKPITPDGSGRPLGIKKALVFYAGKPPHGVKTNWIMHEYRFADADRSAHGSLRLDNWVLCRLYNKKGNWHQDVHKYGSANQQGSPEVEPGDSFEEASPESYVDNGTCSSDVHQLLQGSQMIPDAVVGGASESGDWFAGVNLDDICAETFSAGLDFYFAPTPPPAARPPAHYRQF